MNVAHMISRGIMRETCCFPVDGTKAQKESGDSGRKSSVQRSETDLSWSISGLYRGCVRCGVVAIHLSGVGVCGKKQG